MRESSKEWLKSLVPVSVIADEYYAGNVDPSMRQARVYECLVVVGVNEDVYVDRLRFEQFLYEDIARMIAGRPVKRLDMIRGEESAGLQAKAREHAVENYTALSRIRELQRQELLESDPAERKLLGNAIAGLMVKHALKGKAMRAAEQQLKDFMTEYGSQPISAKTKREKVKPVAAKPDKQVKETAKPQKPKRRTKAEIAADAKAKRLEVIEKNRKKYGL